MRHVAALLFATLMLFGQPAGAAPVAVGVGGYSFPPFVEANQETPQGVTIDLIAMMNALQSDYHFTFIATSTARRYQDMADGKFSVMLFENPAWGWDAKTVETTRVYLRGDGEVFVALAKPGRTQAFFQDLATHTLICVAGYHYGFAGFDADPATLQRQFKVTFADDSPAMLRMLFKERGEIGIVTRSYLQRHLRQHPEQRAQLLVSERFDQTYNHTALVKTGSKPTARDIEHILDLGEKSGKLKAIWAKYDLLN